MFSHDFRNPLTVILSSESLLRNYADRLDEKQRASYLGCIEISVRQLLQMLDDMLVVAQMEMDNLNFKPEPLYVEQFLKNIVDGFTVMHRDAHQLFFESSCTVSVMADPRLLRQVVANLISNAIKYSPESSEVHVTLHTHDGYCFLSVQDQGIGIPEADQQRLFDAFHRGSNVGSISGTGLGLAIVKQAVDLLGGSINLASGVSTGTIVIVAIPHIAPLV